jgi:hypothetical protein
LEFFFTRTCLLLGGMTITLTPPTGGGGGGSACPSTVWDSSTTCVSTCSCEDSIVELFGSERCSGSDDVTDGVGITTGDEVEVSESFCCLGVGKGDASFAFWSFMDQVTARVLNDHTVLSYVAKNIT